MRYLIRLTFFLLSFFNSFSQSKSEKIEYLYDKVENYNSLTIPDSTSFLPLKGDINNGLDNGVYWFKIAPEKVSEKIIIINNSHILKGEVYSNNTLILPLKGKAFLTFSIPKTSKSVYLKIIAEREAYIPIKIREEENFLKNKFLKSFFNGIYYGFILIIFILNLFYFIHFKEITFYHYLYALISLNITLAFADGTFNMLFNNHNCLKKIELLNHFFMGIAGYLFASSYLELDLYIPKSRRIGKLLLVLLVPFVLYYFVFNQFIFYFIVEFIVFIILGIYLTYGFILHKKSNFAKYFCWAYTIIFFTGLEYYVTRDLGINIIEIKPLHLKIGGITEMLFISFAIVYRMNVLKKENELMRKAIFEYAEEIDKLKLDDKREKIRLTEEQFTTQELEIIQQISKGLTNNEIAKKMFISVNTVKYHSKKIYLKLQVVSRKELQNKEFHIVKKETI